MAIKEQVIEMIKKLPDDISIEDILAELHFRYQVDEGLRQLDHGQGIPHEEVEAVEVTHISSHGV